MIRAHVNAFKAMLTGKSSETYDGEVPDGAETPYSILYTDDGPEGQVMFDGSRSVRVWTFSTQHFGSTPDEARWEAEKVRAGLIGKRPVVGDAQCTRIRGPLSSQGMRRDDSVAGQRLFYTVTVWRFASVPTRTA